MSIKNLDYNVNLVDYNILCVNFDLDDVFYLYIDLNLSTELDNYVKIDVYIYLNNNIIIANNVNLSKYFILNFISI